MFGSCIDLGVGAFLWATLAALGIALLTITIRAALADPVKALRYIARHPLQ